MCVNLSIFAKFTQTRSRKFYLHKLDLNRVVLEESCLKFLRENLAGNSCRKILREILAGKGEGEKANLRKAVIGGNLAFGIG